MNEYTVYYLKGFENEMEFSMDVYANSEKHAENIIMSDPTVNRVTKVKLI
jgi:hypothetical protein